MLQGCQRIHRNQEPSLGSARHGGQMERQLSEIQVTHLKTLGSGAFEQVVEPTLFNPVSLTML